MKNVLYCGNSPPRVSIFNPSQTRFRSFEIEIFVPIPALEQPFEVAHCPSGDVIQWAENGAHLFRGENDGGATIQKRRGKVGKLRLLDHKIRPQTCRDFLSWRLLVVNIHTFQFSTNLDFSSYLRIPKGLLKIKSST